MVYSDIWDDIILATILDPSKKSFHFAPEPAAQYFKKKGKDILQNVIVDQQTEIELAEGEEEEGEGEGEGEEEEEEDNDWTRMQLENATREQLKPEIDKYLEMSVSGIKDFKVLQFWRQTNAFPKIKQLVPKVLCVPASSANSERVFSGVGRQLTTKRATLSQARVIKTSFISINKSYCQD